MNVYPAPNHTSLLMSVASRLNALVSKAQELEAMKDQLEDAVEKGRPEQALARRAASWSATANTGLDSAEKLIASEIAVDLGEASIQLMLAISKAQIMAVPSLTDAERRENADAIERLLHSALHVVERAAGVDLADFGRDYYASTKTEPFCRDEEPINDTASEGGETAPKTPAEQADYLARRLNAAVNY